MFENKKGEKEKEEKEKGEKEKGEKEKGEKEKGEKEKGEKEKGEKEKGEKGEKEKGEKEKEGKEEAENPKKIVITGQNNKYQIKKATKQQQVNKERACLLKKNICPTLFEFDKQYELLLLNELPDIIIKEIERKLAGYKQQDVKKKVHIEDSIIPFQQVIQKFIDCKLKCYYCFQSMKLLYKIVRDSQQWTLDRIDNSLGHTYSNIVICCLECNLKRRIQSCNNYLFTKQLKLVKS